MNLMGANELSDAYERLLVVEGPSDACFFRQMRQQELLEPNIAIKCLSDFGGGAGVDYLGKYLKALTALRNFPNYKSIGILVDADLSPTNRYEEIIAHIKNANMSCNNYYSIPDRLGVKATNGTIDVTALLLPDNNNCGCLEDLLLMGLEANRPDALKCSENFLNCIDKENNNQLSKKKVNALISALCDKNPGCTLSKLWKRAPDIISVEWPEFQSIARLINQI